MEKVPSKEQLAAMAGICVDSARRRLYKYERGIYTYEQLMSPRTKPHGNNFIAGRERISVEIDGEVLYAVDLAERAKIGVAGAANRMYQFKRGMISKEILLHVGPIPARKFQRRGTDEWRAMSDKARRISTFEPGTWEKKHIKDRPVNHRGTAAKRGINETAEYKSPVAYSGQFIITI